MTHRAPRSLLRTRLASLSVLALAACGGSGGDGGGSSNPLTPPAATPMQVSGTVATAGPLAGSTVAVACARGNGNTTADASGAFAVTMDDASLPCVVTATSADGGTVLHSIAPGASAADTTVEVTPLTELLVAQFAGAAPGDWAAGFGATTVVDAATLQQAQAALLQSLTRANVDVSGVTNVVSDPLQPGSGSGYDAALQHLASALSDSASSMEQLTSAVATSAGAGAATSQSTLGTLLAVSNADCPALKSGQHRSIDFGGQSDSVISVDARALTVQVDGVTRHLTPIDTCLFRLDDPAATQLAVARSGMGVWRQGGGGVQADLGMTLPEQTLDVAALAGAFNRISYAGSTIASGDFGAETFDAAGHHTASLQCAAYGNCVAVPNLRAHLEADAAGGFDYFDENDASPTIDARAFAYRDASGRTWIVAYTGEAVLFLAPQDTLALPAVGSSSAYWQLDVTPASLGAFVADAATTIAADATTGTTTRQFASDGHTDTLAFNDPAPGLRHRAANACLTAGSGPRSCNAVVQMPLTGSGITAVVSADPARHFLSLSVGRPS